MDKINEYDRLKAQKNRILKKRKATEMTKEWCIIAAKDEQIGELQAENAELVALLEDAQFLLDDACKVPFVDPANSEAVSRLGDKIGYGALMTTASAIWRIRLGDLAGGEFCCSPCRTTAVNLRRRIDAKLKEHGHD